ncbi:MAG: DUF5947 family protein [Sporichthyaceae bacterium]
MSGAGGLRRFVARPEPALPFATNGRPRPRGEGCEMCNEIIGAEHPHVVNVITRSLLCTCRPCYLLFTQAGAGRGTYRSVPDRYLADDGVALTESQWDDLQVPVAMAFFFHNCAQDRVVAQYPSPAGATESLLDLAAWDRIVAENSLAAALESDVEALIVHRTREGDRDVMHSYLVPIDACYELVGRVRLHWTGFDGGAEARADIGEFFARVRARSRVLVHEASRG